MFPQKKTKDEVQLLETIDELYADLRGRDAHTKEYGIVSDQLQKLMRLKADIQAKTRVDANTVALIAANLIGIILILQHERIHVIGSKALSFVGKLR